jgi:antagonist of KipI
MSLRVLDGGLFSLMVDAGRPAHRGLGVPIGGAADRTAHALGNALVGNPETTVALEVSLRGPTLQALAPVAVVLSGADFDARTDRGALRSAMTYTLALGEILRIGGARCGMRGYLCVPGGFHSPKILGSRTALAPIHAGSELTCASGVMPSRFLAEDAPSAVARTNHVELRTLAGTHSDWFAHDALCERRFTVSAASNRMGIRLQSEAIDVPKREIVSEPVCPGTIQVTNDGQCIILGVDGQTIGGYPRIGHVIQADLDKVGQLRPNQSVTFRIVTLAEAEAAWLAYRAELYTWKARLAVRFDCPGILANDSV